MYSGAKTVPRNHANRNSPYKTSEDMQISAIKSIENAKILASSTDGYIEAFTNEKFKILGAMWHFERESKPSEASKKIFEILKGLK